MLYFGFIHLKVFFNSLVISLWPIGCLRVSCLDFTYLWIFWISFCYWFLHSFRCGRRRYFVWLQTFLFYWDLLCGLTNGIPWRMCHVHLRRMCILLCYIECAIYVFCWGMGPWNSLVRFLWCHSISPEEHPLVLLAVWVCQ